MMQELDKLIAAELQRTIRLRHDLHAHPQTAFQETYAAGRIQQELRDAGVPTQGGLAGTGVAAWLAPPDPAAATRRALGLRADIDALPMQEETQLPYASQNPGCMHACGHDGNTAMLVGAARVLAQLRDRLPQAVKFIFQPAEEGGGGAPKMIEAGVLSAAMGGAEVGMIFALHGRSEIKIGQIGICAGAAGARADEFCVTVVGKGGHGARPETTRDPLVAAAAIVTALQTVVARNVPPAEAAVVTVGYIFGGSKDNIIPDSVTMGGTMRTFDDRVAEMVQRRIAEIADHTAQAHGCAARIDWPECYPVQVNHPIAAGHAARTAENFLGAANVLQSPPSMGAEDFAYFCRAVPGCAVLVGLCPRERDSCPELHSSRFDFNDAALALGVKLLCLLALRPLPEVTE